MFERCINCQKEIVYVHIPFALRHKSNYILAMHKEDAEGKRIVFPETLSTFQRYNRRRKLANYCISRSTKEQWDYKTSTIERSLIEESRRLED